MYPDTLLIVCISYSLLLESLKPLVYRNTLSAIRDNLTLHLCISLLFLLLSHYFSLISSTLLNKDGERGYPCLSWFYRKCLSFSPFGEKSTINLCKCTERENPYWLKIWCSKNIAESAVKKRGKGGKLIQPWSIEATSFLFFGTWRSSSWEALNLWTVVFSMIYADIELVLYRQIGMVFL